MSSEPSGTLSLLSWSLMTWYDTCGLSVGETQCIRAVVCISGCFNLTPHSPKKGMLLGLTDYFNLIMYTPQILSGSWQILYITQPGKVPPPPPPPKIFLTQVLLLNDSFLKGMGMPATQANYLINSLTSVCTTLLSICFVRTFVLLRFMETLSCTVHTRNHPFSDSGHLWSVIPTSKNTAR